jgi:CheY-like chemotaxis protein
VSEGFEVRRAIKRYLCVHALAEQQRRQVFAPQVAGLPSAAAMAGEVLKVLEDVREVCRQDVGLQRSNNRSRRANSNPREPSHLPAVGTGVGEMVVTADAQFPNADAKPVVVLVVEDEVFIRMALAEALRDLGLTVIEAMNADEALSAIHSGIVPDAVVTDVRMPGSMDGLRLAELLESMFPGIVAFVASASFTSAELEVRTNFLPKPFDASVAAQTIKNALDRV